MASRQVVLEATVAPVTGTKVSTLCPLAGKIVQIMFNFPDGCNGLVDAQFYRNGPPQTWLAPEKANTFLSMNNVFIPFIADEPVGHGEELWLIVDNHDAVATHTITVVATVIGEE